VTEPKEAEELAREEREDAWRVALPQFEGPLDLLLHLIQQHEVDIFDIPISFITEKYLEYIMFMQAIAIDVASEYLVMAATLAHIKSKMLLPVPPSDQDDGLDEDDLDPRAELVRRLLEYQKYKHAAHDLASRGLLGSDVFPRGAAPEKAVVEELAPLEGCSVFSLIDAFNRIVTARKIKVEHQVDFERVSITERINEMIDILKVRTRVTIEELLPETFSRIELVITFLALLEMTRMKLTRLYQADPLSDLYVELALLENGEAPEPDPARIVDV